MKNIHKYTLCKMKLVLVTCFCISASWAQFHPLSDEFIDEINEKQSFWLAGHNFPPNTTPEQLKKRNGFLGLHPNASIQPKLKVHNFDAEEIPDSFDARKKWPSCASINRIRDQGACGSCWAFAAVESLSDRLCIHSKNSEDFTFSPEELLSCCSACGTCDGGYMMPAYDYYINQGLVSGGDVQTNDGCLPYASEAYDNGDTPKCIKTCRDGYSVSYNSDKHFGSTDYVVDNAIDQIQFEIMTNGPLIVNFEVFADFYNYKSGVYVYTSGKSEGYHVVKIIGWGEDNGLPYWLIANSWGDWWGENGFFKIRRGTNEVGIENYPYAALPRFNTQ